MWSTVEMMTGNPINRTCVHDSVNLSTACAPQLFGNAKTIKKLPKMQSVYVK
jgi:hypothetical protein